MIIKKIYHKFDLPFGPNWNFLKFNEKTYYWVGTSTNFF